MRKSGEIPTGSIYKASDDVQKCSFISDLSQYLPREWSRAMSPLAGGRQNA